MNFSSSVIKKVSMTSMRYQRMNGFLVRNSNNNNKLFRAAPNNGPLHATTMNDGCRRSVTIDLADTRLNKLPSTGTQTKIVCTLGPASDDKIDQLMRHGMHVARLNFSHAGTDYSYPESLVDKIRAVQGRHQTMQEGRVEGVEMEMPNNVRAILVDTKGPEIRTGPLPGDQESMWIETEAKVVVTIDDVSNHPIPEEGDNNRYIQIDYQSIAKTVQVGSMVLLDDGLIALEVEEIDPSGRSIVCTALNAGPIKKNKGVNLPGMELDLPALTDKDRRDLKWACEVGVDYIAASFIRNGANVRSVIAFLERCIENLPDIDKKPRIRPLVISKIENKEGVDNFDEILHESDGIMVARGDLGVEIPYSKVFKAQKMMVEKCNEQGKPVIVATQMLDSMMRNPRPTRAEVTDVGTAVLDGTDAVMLSGETAAGSYPIDSVKSMASVVHEGDVIRDDKRSMMWNKAFYDGLSPEDKELESLAGSAVKAAMVLPADKIILISKTGRVAKAVARHKPNVPVLAFCTDAQVARRLQLYRGITPLMLQTDLDPKAATTSMSRLRAEATRTAREIGFVKAGDTIIFVDTKAGRPHEMHDFSHNLTIVTLN